MERQFVNYTSKDIAEELIYDYNKDIDDETIRNLVINKANEFYNYKINGNYNDSVREIFRNKIKKTVHTIKCAGRDSLEKIISDPSFVQEVEADSEGYPLIDKYLEKLLSPNGAINKKIQELINNIDFTDIVDEVRAAYIDYLSQTNWEDGQITREKAKTALDTSYPGIKILSIDDGYVDDLVTELTFRRR